MHVDNVSFLQKKIVEAQYNSCLPMTNTKNNEMNGTSRKKIARTSSGITPAMRLVKETAFFL